MRLRRWGIALALLLVVLGAPARQAEAASDLARTIDEIGEPSRCEEVDGGVGDDQLEAPRSDATDQGDLAPGSEWLGESDLLGVADIRCPGPSLGGRAEARRFWGVPAPSARLAWLQRFRC